MVIFQIGTNDIRFNGKSRMLQDWSELIADTQSRMPSAKILMCEIPPANDAGLQNDLREANEWLRRACMEKRVGLVMNQNIAQCQKPFNRDGIHLSTEGFYVLAENIKQAIDQNMENN